MLFPCALGVEILDVEILGLRDLEVLVLQLAADKLLVGDFRYNKEQLPDEFSV